MRQFTFAGVPADSSGQQGRFDQAPSALRDLGLATAIDAIDVGDLDTLITGRRRDSDSGLNALEGVIEATLVLERRTSQLVQNGKMPFLCGGCSALAVGAVAGAAAALGQIGLVYVNAHSSLHDGETSPTGHAASMALAALLGRGPQVWTALLGPGPILKSDHISLIGVRDHEETEQSGTLVRTDFQPPIREFTNEQIRTQGAASVGQATEKLLAQSPGHFWVHLDLDVMDEMVFPATGSLLPGGLDWEELGAVLGPLLTSRHLAGISLAGYDPGRDEGSSCGLHLVDLFRSVCR
ncbi:MAG: arginase family protein [Pseudomonadota bacterium]